MKKFLIFFILICQTSVLAGLYDDILDNDNPYSNCKTLEEATALYNQRMRIYDRMLYNYTIQDNYNKPQRSDIKYGYNAVGDYVPTSIGNQQIHYGYNAYGDYVPMYIGE